MFPLQRVDIVPSLLFGLQQRLRGLEPVLAPAPDGFPLLLADRTLVNDAEAWAGYLQADLNITDQLTLTAGVRYTDETKTITVRDNRARVGNTNLCSAPNQFGPSPCIEDANLIAPNGVPIPTEQSVDLWTPRFAINYSPNDDILLFASATRGFKSGGWAARAFSPNLFLPFGPETAWSYEAGAKTELLDRRLRFNITGFWLDVQDLQTPSAFVNPDGSLTFITRNFADYENKGVEIEITAVPTERLNLFAAIGYQDDQYNIDDSAPAEDIFGIQSVSVQQQDCLAQLAAGRLPNGPNAADNAESCGVGIVAPDGSISTPVRTPEWTVSVGGSYDFDFGDFTLTPAVNANWRSDSEVGTSEVTFFEQDVTGNSGTVYPTNTLGLGDPIDPITGSFSEQRWIVNGTLTLRNVSGWALTAECRNCFDEEAVESSLANFSYLNPPRTWMVRARYDF